MRRSGITTLTGAGLLLLSLVVGRGTDPIGRVLLDLGLPTAARPFLSDPAWKGAASYRAGSFGDAMEAFVLAGPGFELNLGNALVHQENYAAALEMFDLGRSIGDPDATANFDLVAAYYAGLSVDPDAIVRWVGDKEGDLVVEADVGEGNARAAGEGDEVTNTGSLIGLPEVRSNARLAVRKVFDDKFVVASPRWLATLSDAPGDFMAARISHEHKRRRRLGLSPPDPEDPN